MMPLAFLFLLSISLAICGLVCFHMGFRIVFTLSIRNAVGILAGIGIEFVAYIGYQGYFENINMTSFNM